MSFVANLKSSTQLVIALAGLVTAVTSLMKACDKRLEQASYEALAESIKDLQDDQRALRNEIAMAQIGAPAAQPVMSEKTWCGDGDGIPDFDLKSTPSPLPSASSVMLTNPHPVPCYASIVSKPAVWPSAMPRVPTMPTIAPAPSSKPLPSWSDVKQRADAL
jgi:hypothetical protein